MSQRSLTALTGALVLVAAAFVACAPSEIELAATAGATPDSRAGEYVVAFDGGAGGAAAAARAVRGAGGEVVATNAEAGVLLAAADGDGFLDRVAGAGAVAGAARNHAVGATRPGGPHRWAELRPSAAERAREPHLAVPFAGAAGPLAAAGPVAEPLAARQWDMAMVGATPDGAHRHATGRGVRVGIIDTGIDATHPDLAPNVDVEASRNFTTDIPELDGPCEVPSCVDPAPGDGDGHGTHVAGTVAAAADGRGIAGVAPDATLVDLRAGQDSGYFFLWETVAALTYAGAAGLDVVNMSFYTDPWLYNCDSRDDYVTGEVTERGLAEQRVARRVLTRALAYAHDRGVTLVAAAANEATDLGAPWRRDATSPDAPKGAAQARVVTRDCPSLPAEGPHVLTVSSVGPSGDKADYSNYGLGVVDLAAPGGYLYDPRGLAGERPSIRNAVLSSYPLDRAIAEGLAGPDGAPADAASLRDCDGAGRCGFYTYLQGTSMASPHVAGVAALVVEAHGEPGSGGPSLDPDAVARVLAATARDRACPEGLVDYTRVGRPAEWNASCAGPATDNGFYGEGIVDAPAAVNAGA